MCGFAGFVGGPVRDEQRRRAILHGMGRQLARRGPDDEQLYVDHDLALIFRRLSIVDIAHGRQPLWNEDGSVMAVVNGEIYNHESLRRRLAGRHQFATRSDSEVVLHLYEEMGTSFLDELSGMYAIAIWDTRRRTLILARDRLGIKPLFYTQVAGSFLFGSELKALLVHPDCPNELDWESCGTVQAGLLQRLSTFIKGIEALPGGHYLVLDENGRTTTNCYWNGQAHFHQPTEAFDLTPNQCIDRYRTLIEQSVHRHLLGEARIGIFLSGGLDSALLLAMCADRIPDLHCYSVLERAIFLTGDSERASSLARRFGVRHHQMLCDHNRLLDDLEFSLESLEFYVWALEMPLFSVEFLFKHELHRYAKSTLPALKVVLNGQGADEFCGGYSNQYPRHRRNRDAQAGWQAFLNALGTGQRKTGLARLHVVEELQDLVADTPLYGSTSIASLPDERPALSQRSIMQREVSSYLIRLQNYNLWHEDRTASIQGVETRVPFLDHELVEFLLSIPPSYHPQLFYDKQIERRAAAQWLGAEALAQPKVGFFLSHDMSSIAHLNLMLISRVYRPFAHKYLDDSQALFQREAVDVLYARVRAQRGLGRETDLLMSVMVISIFERMLRTRMQEVDVQLMQPPSPLPEAQTFSAETWQMTPHPGAASWWVDDQTVRLASGIEVLTRLGTEPGSQDLVVVKDKKVLTSMNLDPYNSWWQPMLSLVQGSQVGASVAEIVQITGQDHASVAEILAAMFRAGIFVLGSEDDTSPPTPPPSQPALECR